MVGGAAITDAVQGHVTNTARQDVVTLDAAVSHAATSPIPSCADHSGWYARTLLGARKIAADVSDHRSPAVIGADLKRAHEALENAEAELKAGK
jgi:hypothetical protein